MSPRTNSTRNNNQGASQVKTEEKLASLPIAKGTKRNFSQEEDLQICRSYIYHMIENKDNVNSKSIWKDIAQHFKESLREQDFVCQREKESIRARWLGTLNPRTLEFASCVRKTAKKNQGESNITYDIPLAHKIYRQVHNDSKFRFLNCFEFMKKYNRWNPNPTISSGRGRRRNYTRATTQEDVYASMMESIDSDKQVEVSDNVALKCFNPISSCESGLVLKDLSSMTELSLMLVDPTTIKQPKRRLWIEQKQAEILKRDNI